MTRLTEHTLQRGGSTLHYWLAGPEDAPLVTLTHGATMDHRMFDAQLPALTPEYRVLVWDVRGHGVSQPIGDEFSMTVAADDLLALLDREGVERAVFAGQSMGGHIAQNVLLRFPERVLALVTIGATDVTRRYSTLDRLGLMITPPTLRLWPYENLKRVVAKTTAITPEARRYAYEAISQVRQRDFADIMGAVAAGLDPRPGYQIPVPALLTHGDRDNTGKIKAYAQAWADAQPNAEYVVIPDAGHNANQDNPAFFNRLLLDFLHRHVPTGTQTGSL